MLLLQKEDIMYAHDKRHSYGTFQPNLFFFLQLVAITLLAYMFVEIASLLSLSSLFVYFMVIMGMFAISYCIERRKMIIRRQKFC